MQNNTRKHQERAYSFIRRTRSGFPVADSILARRVHPMMQDVWKSWIQLNETKLNLPSHLRFSNRLPSQWLPALLRSSVAQSMRKPAQRRDVCFLECTDADSSIVPTSSIPCSQQRWCAKDVGFASSTFPKLYVRLRVLTGCCPWPADLVGDWLGLGWDHPRRGVGVLFAFIAIIITYQSAAATITDDRRCRPCWYRSMRHAAKRYSSGKMGQ